MLALFVLFTIATAQTASDCTTFCTDYNTTCMGLDAMNNIYTDMAACEAECMKFPADSNCADGSDAALCASGNSWGCRRYHLNVAMSNASDPSLAMTHCPHTTPVSSPTADLTAANALSGTVCVSRVNGTAGTPIPQNGLVADFCNTVSNSCGGYLGGLTKEKCVSFYSNLDGITDIANYPDGTNRKFPLQATAGAGLPCRRYHAQVARSEADPHCLHALFGDDACGSTCATYCTLLARICPGEHTATCEADCADDIPEAENWMQITNKDIVCRLYHMSVASESAANAMVHCAHAGIMSTEDTCADGAATLSVSAIMIAALAMLAKFSS